MQSYIRIFLCVTFTNGKTSSSTTEVTLLQSLEAISTGEIILSHTRLIFLLLWGKDFFSPLFGNQAIWQYQISQISQQFHHQVNIHSLESLIKIDSGRDIILLSQ